MPIGLMVCLRHEAVQWSGDECCGRNTTVKLSCSSSWAQESAVPSQQLPLRDTWQGRMTCDIWQGHVTGTYDM